MKALLAILMLVVLTQDASALSRSSDTSLMIGSWAVDVSRLPMSTYALDGSVSPVEGSMEADTTAVSMPAPNVLVMALGKGGIPASTRIFTVTADGKTQIETAVHFGDDGVPVMRTNYFTRVR